MNCVQPAPVTRRGFCISVGWSSQVAHRAHNPKVVSSNLTPATSLERSGNAATDIEV